jgi:hypothetical protein
VQNAPYFHWSWYERQDEDFKNVEVFPDNQEKQQIKALMVLLSLLVGEDLTKISSNRMMRLYNEGGFELGRIVERLSAEVSIPSSLLQAMFKVATYPSGVNGHVSLSADIAVNLGEVSVHWQGPFYQFLFENDAELGQSYYDFLVANGGGVPLPYSSLTDPKREGSFALGFSKMYSNLSD